MGAVISVLAAGLCGFFGYKWYEERKRRIAVENQVKQVKNMIRKDVESSPKRKNKMNKRDKKIDKMSKSIQKNGNGGKTIKKELLNNLQSRKIEGMQL